ncbi:MAG: hypothetical protein M0Z58_08960 [Nitrospiraceae bacterium]|nr:hypothetical protein [Nitrospiraceae bacterium]
MKKRGFFLRFSCAAAFIAAVALAGCATPRARYSPSEISGYPPNIQKLIQQGTVEMGMTPDQVRFAWGAPSYITVLPPASDGQPRERWTYKEVLGTASTMLLFTGGKVMEMTSTGLASKKFIAPGTGGQ